SEVQAQTKSIKAYCKEYEQALESVSKVTTGFGVAPGLKGQAMDSMKSYLSTMYPSVCKAVILHGEEIVQANESYLNDYISEFGAVDLDSEELEEEIRNAENMIQSFQNFKDS